MSTEVEREDVFVPIFIQDEQVGTISLAENGSYSIVMHAGTVGRLRSDILFDKVRIFGVIPVMDYVPEKTVADGTFNPLTTMVDNQNLRDARVDAVRAVARLGSAVHPGSFTRVAGEIESYILNGYAEPDPKRTETKFVERLRFRGFGEAEISDIMNALRDGDLSVYTTRK